MRRLPALLLILALAQAALFAAVREQDGRPVYFLDGKPFFVYSATFTYWDYPPDLWPDLLVRLKGLGFNTLQIPAAPAGGTGLLELLRLVRRLNLHVWIEDASDAPELEPFRGARGGPILDDLTGHAATWFPAEDATAGQQRFLHATDFTSLRRLLEGQSKRRDFPPLLSAFDAGWPAAGDLHPRPSEPSNHLLAFRETLLAGAKVLNCPALVEGRSAPEHEPALALTGAGRPQAPVFGRHGAIIRQFGSLLATLEPLDAATARRSLSLVRQPGDKPSPTLRLGMLVSHDPRGPAFVSALNYSDDRALHGTLTLPSPRTGRPVLLRNVVLPPREALLIPLNLPLAAPEVCPTCAAFAPHERLVSATAELIAMAYENGVLGMEFIAPSEGELVLELARRPRGPVIAGARLRDFEFDDKTHLFRVRIPAGPAPDFRSRVGIGVELPESSVFLKTPPRLVLGSTARVTATFSSEELATRARLLPPPGWPVRSESRSATETDYLLDVPADAVAGDTVTLAVEADGRIAQSASLPLAPPWTVRIEPEESLHPRPGEEFPLRPYLATLPLAVGRTYTIRLRNGYDEIRTLVVAAAGEGLRFSTLRQEVSIGANLEREVSLTVSAAARRPGLYRWTLEITDGTRRTQTTLALAALAPDEPLAYEYDVDRDGFPDLVLENQRLRAVFSPHLGGRALEFLLKDRRANAFAPRGTLDTGSPLEGRIVGPGRLELSGGGLVRLVSLGAADDFLAIEQTGGAAEWQVLSPLRGQPQESRLSILSPEGQVELQRKPFSTFYRIRFPASGPRRAHFSLLGPG